MSPELTFTDVVVRIVAGTVAGAAIGLNRSERDRPAGLRTTILVCLAATGAMILGNLLLPTAGKPPDGFAAMDIMRLPLGILTGVGFIGAGAILHKSDGVLGVTTAATMWFTTVMGLCIGAGEFALGALLLVIGIAVLWGLKRVESGLSPRRRAQLVVGVEGHLFTAEKLIAQLQTADLRVKRLSILAEPTLLQYDCEIEWEAPTGRVEPPESIQQLAAEATVVRLEWKPK
jgi:putative Mg2+ transporter-C (MgtC) family protein